RRLPQPRLDAIDAELAAAVAGVAVGDRRPERLTLAGRAGLAEGCPQEIGGAADVAPLQARARPFPLDLGPLGGRARRSRGGDVAAGGRVFPGAEGRAGEPGLILRAPLGAGEGPGEAQGRPLELPALRQLVRAKERLAIAEPL